ncbi:MAG: helix-turn-helix transcriptional regulator [Clostridia bacterium]|nr:helix-turn-helix transcriptional regulator [Clostridia bacterium]
MPQPDNNTSSIKMLNEDVYPKLASLFKLFGDTTRLRILHALEQKELCVGDLAALLDITESAVSHQLKALKLSNLVKYRRDGQSVFYSLADDHVKILIDIALEHIME